MKTSEPMVLKLALLGEESVGKTSILDQFINHKFSPSRKLTVCVAVSCYLTEVDSHRIEVKLWDTAGEARYRPLLPLYSVKALGAMAVYDLTRPETFTELTSFGIPSFLERAHEKAKVAIVGNKADLVEMDGEVEQKAREFARAKGHLHYTVSAKTGEGIGKVFEELVGQIVRSGLVDGIPASPGAAIERDTESSCFGGQRKRRRKHGPCQVDQPDTDYLEFM
jgi:small GTP-binding protein